MYSLTIPTNNEREKHSLGEKTNYLFWKQPLRTPNLCISRARWVIKCL